MPRRGRKACAKALRWEGEHDWRAVQSESGEGGRLGGLLRILLLP